MKKIRFRVTFSQDLYIMIYTLSSCVRIMNHDNITTNNVIHGFNRVSDVIVIVDGDLQSAKEIDPNANSVNQFNHGEWISQIM